ncbi:MAG: hypothetical protein ACO1NZ_10380 [Adhaeribacter sp.]
MKKKLPVRAGRQKGELKGKGNKPASQVQAIKLPAAEKELSLGKYPNFF